jgi:hypothetical protein
VIFFLLHEEKTDNKQIEDIKLKLTFPLISRKWKTNAEQVLDGDTT